jgi:Protein of unknown function (DUF3352)
MPTRRTFIAAVLTTLALTLAACGGGGDVSEGGGGASPSGAALVRAGVLAFVSIDSDLGSGQWQQLDELAHKFPGRDRAIARIKEAFTKEGVDYDDDVKPALGPEVDLAIVSGGTSSSTKTVVLTKPDDPGKFKALVAKLNASDSSGNDAVFREVDGWYALSDSQGAITEALKGDRTALSDDSAFKEALGKLPGDALVKAFVDGQRVNALVGQAASQSGSGLDASSLGLDTLKYISASASAEDDGVRIRGASSGGNLGGADFTSKLIDGVPGDALALLSFRGEGTTDQLGKLESNPQVGAALAQIEKALGVPFDQVLAMLRGEIAFYVRPGAGIPELTLALEEKDESGALATLDRIAARLAAATGARVEPGTQGGHPVKTINFGQFAVHYGVVDGKILITSGVSGIADYGSGDHLAGSADFEQAKDVAGMPDSNGGFMYVDLKNALPLLEGFAGLAGQGLPSEVTDNLRPLRSFLAWSEGSRSARTFDAFLAIK